MYDDVTLPALLRAYGFQDIARRERAQSPWIPEVADVEGSAINDYADSLYLDARANQSQNVDDPRN